jgi:hypothetical protein
MPYLVAELACADDVLNPPMTFYERVQVDAVLQEVGGDGIQASPTTED